MSAAFSSTRSPTWSSASTIRPSRRASALPFFRALIEGLKFAVLTLIVYLCALPFILFAGLGVVILLLANAYLLGREYFELAAMRFHPPDEAKALRKRNAGAVFLAGLVIAVFVSIPIVNFATPIFAMAFMVHVHKRLAGKRAELIEPALGASSSPACR